MSDDALLRQIQALEDDNARLRQLLDQRGSTTGRRHQLRNTLAMVRHIVRQSAERFDGVEDYAGQLEGRLDAVFRIQTIIANTPVDRISLDTLIMDEMLVHALNEDTRLSIDGPDVQLQPAAAGAVGLALHELATNAIRFGALSIPTGRLIVDWSTSAEGGGRPWLTLRWIESGVATVVSPHRHQGFGSEVIEHSISYQLGGEGRLAFEPGGLYCTIRLPL